MEYELYIDRDGELWPRSKVEDLCQVEIEEMGIRPYAYASV
jgi:hypothetical protein